VAKSIREDVASILEHSGCRFPQAFSICNLNGQHVAKKEAVLNWEQWQSRGCSVKVCKFLA
jgi:hypothetical protein